MKALAADGVKGLAPADRAADRKIWPVLALGGLECRLATTTTTAATTTITTPTIVSLVTSDRWPADDAGAAGRAVSTGGPPGGGPGGDPAVPGTVGGSLVMRVPPQPQAFGGTSSETEIVSPTSVSADTSSVMPCISQSV